MKICEKCFKEHTGEYATGRFCSSICSRSYSSMISRKETNEKISKKLKGSGNPNIIKNCKNCFNSFEITYSYRDQLFCSVKCSTIWKNN